MQKTTIEWCDSTWNPVTGCERGCDYCYARKIATRFGGWTKDGVKTAEVPLGESLVLDAPLPLVQKGGKEGHAPFPFGFAPTFHRYRLEEAMAEKTAQNVFVCSMADLFAPWVPTQWISDVMQACEAAQQHRYLFLTKFPGRYIDLYDAGVLPSKDNFWYGSTLTNADSDQMFWSEKHNTFISIEPLLEPFIRPERNPLTHVKWVIIGAETGKRKGKVVPEKEWVMDIVHYCRDVGRPVFMKDSLIPIVGKGNMIREFPW